MIDKLPPADFEQLGFMCGLEIHQQLDTKQKLFCRCPVGLRHEPPDATLLRHMRPTLSELGEYDGTALMEFKTRKNVVYQLVKGSTCTYEMDDTPPFELNQQALDIALELSLLLNCNIVDEIHISRKQYLDGSIPTGFQRTAVVGVEGWVPYKDRRIRIIQVCLEEDACREISDIGHTITFKADRLSTPLVEVITYPDMKNPQEAAEVNELLGRLLKASGKVRRGIGTVRQDVNVSINGGTRVEIKGVAKTSYVHDLTYVEALRQKALLDIRSAIEARGVSRKSLTLSNFDLTTLLANTESPSMRAALDSGGVTKCAVINGFAGILNMPTQPGLTFAWEYSGRIKVVACIDKRPNLFHSDAPELSELTSDEWTAIKDHCGCKLTDVAIVVWGEPRDVETALDEIKFRTLEAIRGVPNETRQDIGGGITDFERILPGPDRMYPDTDLPPLAIGEERLRRISDHLPERSYEMEARWRDMGLNDELIRPLTISGKARLFDEIVSDYDADPKLVAVLLTQTIRSLRRNGLNTERITHRSLHELFSMYAKWMFSREAIPMLLEELCMSGNPTTLSQIVEKHNFQSLGGDLEKITQEEVERAKDVTFKDDKQKSRYLMGAIMSRLRGSQPGELVLKMLFDTLRAN
jgi:glutamyl-tRNA(Gln) amidotransferase subunit E